jgi:hypothetical protein
MSVDTARMSECVRHTERGRLLGRLDRRNALPNGRASLAAQPMLGKADSEPRKFDCVPGPVPQSIAI